MDGWDDAWDSLLTQVLRLLMYDADLACGVDLYLEPEPYRDAKNCLSTAEK